MQLIYTIFGYVGSGILSLLFIPQVYTTYKTKNVNDFILLPIKSTCSSIVIFVVSTSIASIALDSGEIFLWES